MRRTLIGLALALPVALPAWAQTKQQIDWCSSTTATDDQTIAGCTAMIQSGRYTGSDLSHAFNNRGTGYSGKHEWDLAIQDATKAIQYDSTNAQAYNNRCYDYQIKDLYDQAIADCTRAIALKRDYARAYGNRGIAYEKKGLRDKAKSDFRAAAKIDPNDSTAKQGLKRLGATP